MGAVLGAIAGGKAEADPLHGACCDAKLSILASKRLELELELLGGSGRGLHEKITTAGAVHGGKLLRETVRQMRKIATLRNKLVHEHGFDDLDDKSGFVEDFRKALASLVALKEEVARASRERAPGGAEEARCTLS